MTTVSSNLLRKATPPRATQLGSPSRSVLENLILLYLTLRFDQTWGIQEVDGKRRYMRHLDFTGPKGEKISTVFCYDYCSSFRFLDFEVFDKSFSVSGL